MANRDLRLSLKIIAEAASAVREIKGVTSSAREMGIEFERTGKRIDTFEKLRQSQVDLGTSLEQTKRRARELTQELVQVAGAEDDLRDVRSLRILQEQLAKAGTEAKKAQQRFREAKADFLLLRDAGLGAGARPELNQAQSGLNRASRTRDTLAAQVAALTGRVADRGVDVGKLAEEENRLRGLVSQFKQLALAQSEALATGKTGERQMAAMTAELNKVSAALKTAGVDTSRLGEAQDKLRQQAAGVANAVQAEAEALQRTQRLANARQSLGLVDTKGLKQQADQARESLNLLRRSGEATNRELVRGFIAATQKAREYAREQNRILPAKNPISSAISGAGSFVGSAAAGAGVIGGGYGLVQTIAEVRDATIKFEGYRIALEAVTGSQERANQAIAFTRDLSQRLGLELSSTTERYTQFAAATRGTRLEGEKGQRVFEQFASTFAVLGLSADRQALAFQAIVQILGKGVVQAEELRGQLAESLPGAVELAARALGVTTAKLNELIKTGQLNGVDFITSFGAQAQKEYGERVPAAIDSSRAAFGRFSNAITDLKVQVGSGGLVDSLTDSIEKITDRLKDPEVVKGLTAIGTGIVDSFGYLVDHSDTILEILAAIAGGKVGSGIGAAIGGTIGLLTPIPGGAAAGAALGSTAGGLIGAGLAAGAVDNALDGNGRSAEAATTKVRDYRSELQQLGQTYADTAAAFQRAGIGLDSQQAESYLAPLRAQIAALKEVSGVSRAEVDQAAANDRIKAATDGALRIAAAANQITRLRASLEATAAFANAQIAVQTTLINEAERRNLITAETAIKRRAELQRRSVQNEIAQRRAELGGVGNQIEQVQAVKTDQGADERAKQLADLDAQRIRLQGQINALKERERGITIETTNAITSQREADEKRLNELQGKLAEQNRDAKGVASATLARLQEEYAADLFGPDKGRADLVGKIIDTQVTQAEFDTVRQQAQDLVTALQAQFQTLSQGVQAGTVGTAQAQNQFSAALATSSPQLNVLLGQMEALAKNLAPEARQQVQSLADSIQGLALSAQTPLQRLLATWRDTGSAMQEVGVNFANNFTDALATLATTGKISFRSLATSIIQDLIRIQIRAAAAGLIGQAIGLTGLFGGASAGAAGASSSLLGPGGIGGQFVGPFADGGLVRGPGSGTSDSIPARLSNGEYVINAASVRQVGTRFLDALNGKTMPSSMRAGVPAFASGGLVGQIGGRSARGGNYSPIVSVPVTVNVPESTSREDSERIAKQTAQAVQATVLSVLSDQMRPGGMLSPA